MTTQFNLNLYLIADFSYSLNKIQEAIKAGVTMVQLREKNISSREYLNNALTLKQITSKYHIPLIINDRVDIALLSKADGVHLGESDLPIDKVRSMVPKDFIIGATVKTLATAKLVEKQGANYIGSGAWFPTTTKLDATLMDPDEYLKIKQSITIPSVAIGGITPLNCELALRYHADGLALSKGILSSTDITSTVTSLKSILATFKNKL